MDIKYAKIDISKDDSRISEDEYIKSFTGLILGDDVFNKDRLLLAKDAVLTETAVKLIHKCKINSIIVEYKDDIYYDKKISNLNGRLLGDLSDVIPDPEEMIPVGVEDISVTETLPEKTQERIKKAIGKVTTNIFKINLNRKDLTKRSSDQIFSPLIKEEFDLELPQKEFIDTVKKIIITISKNDSFYTLATFDELSDKKYNHIATHNVEVMMFVIKTGKKLNLSEENIVDLSISALIWNVGRIAIDNTLFFKKGAYSKSEKKKLFVQNEASYKILSDNEKEVNFYSLVASGKSPPAHIKLDHEKLDSMNEEEKAFFYYHLIKAADAYCGIKRESSYHKKRDIIRTMLIMKEDVRSGKIPIEGYCCFWQAHDLFQSNALFPINFEWIEEIGISKDSLRDFIKVTLFGIVLKIDGMSLRFAVLSGKADYSGNIIRKTLRLVNNKKYNMDFLKGIES